MFKILFVLASIAPIIGFAQFKVGSDFTCTSNEHIRGSYQQYHYVFDFKNKTVQLEERELSIFGQFGTYSAHQILDVQFPKAGAPQVVTIKSSNRNSGKMTTTFDLDDYIGDRQAYIESKRKGKLTTNCIPLYRRTIWQYSIDYDTYKTPFGHYRCTEAELVKCYKEKIMTQEQFSIAASPLQAGDIGFISGVEIVEVKDVDSFVTQHNLDHNLLDYAKQHQYVTKAWEFFMEYTDQKKRTWKTDKVGILLYDKDFGVSMYYYLER